MVAPNYGFAKRQREIAKKQKVEEKRLRKVQAEPDPAAGEKTESDQVSPPADGALPLAPTK